MHRGSGGGRGEQHWAWGRGKVKIQGQVQVLSVTWLGVKGVCVVYSFPRFARTKGQRIRMYQAFSLFIGALKLNLNL